MEGIVGDEWKQFQKENKIKWKDPQSLLLVVDFISKSL